MNEAIEVERTRQREVEPARALTSASLAAARDGRWFRLPSSDRADRARSFPDNRIGLEQIDFARLLGEQHFLLGHLRLQVVDLAAALR